MEYKKDLDFIKQYFGDTKDASGRLIWDHALDTALVLEKSILGQGEISLDKTKHLFLGALGHDILEDTAIKPDELQRMWGDKAFKYIQALTNVKGDGDFSDYMQNLKIAEEEVLLIKLADILSNITNTTKNFKKIDIDWIKTFWLPLLLKYKKELFTRKFLKYPKTAGAMIEEIEINMEELEKGVKISKT
ncbi:MAG: hypothetical protein ACE5F2_02505 [Candidatus Paceibacteria bacterium]